MEKQKQKNFYSQLGLSPQATPHEIRSAFKNLMFETQANLEENNSEEKLIQLIEAYQNLIHPESRKVHDQQLGLGRELIPYDSRICVADNSEDQNRRIWNRIAVDKPIWVRYSNHDQGWGQLKDFSHQGARVLIKKFLLKGGLIEISPDPNSLPFVLAQVVHTIVKGQEYGLQWLEVYEENIPKGFLLDPQRH